MDANPHNWQSRVFWQLEDIGADWYAERFYRQVVCTHCDATRPANPQPKRRLYYTRMQDSDSPPEVIRLLSAERWKRVGDLVNVMGLNRVQVLETLGEWLQAGWIEAEQAQETFSQEWQIERVRLSPAAVARWITSREVERSRQTLADQQFMLALLAGWRDQWEQAARAHPSEQTLLHHMTQILDAQEQALATGQWHPLPETSQQLGGAVHQRWLAVLRGLVDLLAAPRWEYERAFSARWLGDSKAFAAERAVLAAYLGLEDGFESLGLIRHTPVVYAWGNWGANLGDYEIDGRAGMPFVALAAETITALEQIRVTGRGVLIVENQTVFETILRPPYRRDDYLYLFSGGFAGHAERGLLARWLAAQPNLSCFVWTDWDVGGIRIQQHWAGWFAEQGFPTPEPFLWQPALLATWRSLGQTLDETQQHILMEMNTPLADMLLRMGYTLEQEAVLGEFSAAWLAER